MMFWLLAFENITKVYKFIKSSYLLTDWTFMNDCKNIETGCCKSAFMYL